MYNKNVGWSILEEGLDLRFDGIPDLTRFSTITFSRTFLYYLRVDERPISSKGYALSPDDELMIRVKHGDLDKLGVLYEKYNRALFAFFFKVSLNSQASEDLVQTVFFKIIKYRDQYRAEEGSFVTWMFRIAHNANIDHYHSLERSRNEVRIDETDVAGDGDPDEDFLKKERSRRIKEALARLLPLLAEKPPPSDVFEQVALMAAEGSGEYF